MKNCSSCYNHKLHFKWHVHLENLFNFSPPPLLNVFIIWVSKSSRALPNLNLLSFVILKFRLNAFNQAFFLFLADGWLSSIFDLVKKVFHILNTLVSHENKRSSLTQWQRTSFCAVAKNGAIFIFTIIVVVVVLLQKKKN